MDPFLEPDSGSPADAITDAAALVIAEAGVSALSINAIAERLGITRQAVAQRWDGPDGALRRIIQVVTVTFGERWLDWIEPGLMSDVPVITLPNTDAERRGVRVWAALTELAWAQKLTGNPDPAKAVVSVRDRERTGVGNRVGWWIGSRLSDTAISSICALGYGLRSDLAGLRPSLTLDVAGELIRSHLETIRSAHLA